MSTRPNWTPFWILRANLTRLTLKLGPKLGRTQKNGSGLAALMYQILFDAFRQRDSIEMAVFIKKKHKITTRGYCLSTILLLSIYLEFIFVD